MTNNDIVDVKPTKLRIGSCIIPKESVLWRINWKLTDIRIAKMLGMHRIQVVQLRHSLQAIGIIVPEESYCTKIYLSHPEKVIEKQALRNAKIGKVPDWVVAERLGVEKRKIVKIRQEQNIALEEGIVAVKKVSPRNPLESVVGRSIRAARKRRGWTRQRLAFAAKIPREVVRDLEKGLLQPEEKLVEKLLLALGVFRSKEKKKIRTLEHWQPIYRREEAEAGMETPQPSEVEITP